VIDVVVYGVAVPDADGRAGMAAIVPSDEFDLTALYQIAKERLPAYARPLFLRFRRGLDVTETFKPKKQLLADEGFDRGKVSDPLYVADPTAGTYVTLK
jgi:fatty-acyl-CoA synthase